MNHIFKSGSRVILAMAMVFVLAAGAVFMPVQAGESSCGDGLNECLGDAIKVGIFSLNPGAGLAFGLGCVVGYDFCLRYYAPLK